MRAFAGATSDRKSRVLRFAVLLGRKGLVKRRKLHADDRAARFFKWERPIRNARDLRREAWQDGEGASKRGISVAPCNVNGCMQAVCLPDPEPPVADGACRPTMSADTRSVILAVVRVT